MNAEPCRRRHGPKVGFSYGVGRGQSSSGLYTAATATKQEPMGLAQLRSIAATIFSANASGRERNG
jgi:hypothetical protein